MPGVPGYPWPGPDWSAEVHQPCLQCCSAAVLQTVAGVQGDDVVSHQTQRHYHLYHSCRHQHRGAHLAGTGENG